MASVASPVAEQNGELQRRLADPRTQETLERLLSHLDVFACMAEALDEFLRRGETIADNVSEGVQELRQMDLGQTGVGRLLEQAPKLAQTAQRLAETADHADLEALGQSGLLERLTRPETLSLLNRLLDYLPLVVLLVQGLDSFLRRSETVADSVAESTREALGALEHLDLESWSRIAKMLPPLVEAGHQLVESGLLQEAFPKLIQAGQEMLQSGMLDREVVHTLGCLGNALAQSCQEVQQQPIAPIGGIWGLMKALRDPDVQKTVGFAVAVARSFAKKAL